MKQKIVSHLLLVMLLAGCASKTSKSDSVDEAMESNEIETVPVEKAGQLKPIESKGAESIPEVKRETPRGAYAPLSDAYKAGNDEAIYRSAVQIISENSQDAKALNAMGLYHYRKGRFLAARYFFNKALASAPKSNEIYNNLGLVSLALGEQLDAIKFFRKALELKNDDGIAAANLGSIYVQEKDYFKALIVLETAVKKGMREGRTLTNYGIALSAAGKYEEAQKNFEEALKMSSNNQQALYASAVVLIDHLKKPNDGLDQLNRLKFLGPGPEFRNKMNALENRAKAGIK